MKFEPERSPLFALLIFSVISVGLTIQLKTLIYEPEAGFVMPALLCLPIGFSLWIWFGTGYEISEGKLFYKSGPFRGTIPISSINKIRKGGSFSFMGMKPALSPGGIIITYNKFEEIYLAPDDKKGFIEELLRTNPTIILNLPPKT
jgi:hypothetical protein